MANAGRRTKRMSTPRDLTDRLRSLVVWHVVWVAFGVGSIIYAASTTHDPSDCDGQEMSQGDICIETTNGENTGTYSLHQQMASQHASSPVWTWAGLLCFVIAVVLVVMAARTARRLRDAQGA